MLKKYDIAIVGGGINGAGIAALAATHGLRVVLCEQNDFASAASSNSSKLIHGGLRYLEYYEFRLVKEALQEREYLLQAAKHLVKPLQFIIPHQPQVRSRWLLRIGLFLYDHLALNNTLPSSRSFSLKDHAASSYLQPQYDYAYQYTDCTTDDARLVIANLMQARKHGAILYNYTQATQVTRAKKCWEIVLFDKQQQKHTPIEATVLINAAGPWVDTFLQQQARITARHHIRLVKGSHIVIPKLYPEDFAFVLQNDDNRIIFVIPYLENFTLIGTTDCYFLGDPHSAVITEEEVAYLLNAIGRYFKTRINKNEIIHTFSGIRPLLKDSAENPAAVTREYAIEVNDQLAPIVSIFGGKLTTYHSLSEKVVNLLQPYFMQHNLQAHINMILPGSDYDNDQELTTQLQQRFYWMNPALLARYQHQYGNATFDLFSRYKNIQELGQDFGANLYQAEVDYLLQHEWVKTAEDILWRRTKLGYSFPTENIASLDTYITKFSKEK